MSVPVVASVRCFVAFSGSQLRFFLALTATSALCGCMTLSDTVPPPPPAETALPPMEMRPAILPEVAPPALPAVPPVSARRPATPSRTVREARAAPAPRPARPARSVDPEGLIGLDPAAVEKLLGAPARIRDDKLSREWVYASPGCNFRVFFYPVLNAASFRVLKYGGADDNGARIEVSDICVRRILMARANATD